MVDGALGELFMQAAFGGSDCADIRRSEIPAQGNLILNSTVNYTHEKDFGKGAL